MPLSCYNARSRNRIQGDSDLYELPETPRSEGMIGGTDDSTNGGHGSGEANFIRFMEDAFRGAANAAARLCPTEEQRNCCEEYRSSASLSFPEGHPLRLDNDLYSCCHCESITVRFHVLETPTDPDVFTDVFRSDEWRDAYGSISAFGSEARFDCSLRSWEGTGGTSLRDTLRRLADDE